MKKLGHKLLCLLLLTSPFLLYRPKKPKIISQKVNNDGSVKVSYINKYDDTILLESITASEYNGLFK